MNDKMLLLAMFGVGVEGSTGSFYGLRFCLAWTLVAGVKSAYLNERNIW